MTASDRIKALCDEALKKPEITVTEKMLETPAPQLAPPSSSRLKVENAPAPVQEPAAEVVTDAPKAFVAPAVEQKHVEEDTELVAMLEEREAKLKTRSKRVRIVANVMLLLAVVTPVTAVAVNPELRGKFEVFVQHLGEGVEDVKSIGNTKESFDEALDKVAVHGDHINNATAMLGVDPNSVSEDDDLEMTAEMKQFMGEEADGFQTRKANLNKMGFLAKKVADATGIEKEDQAAQ
jgi:hypothetical protein